MVVTFRDQSPGPIWGFFGIAPDDCPLISMQQNNDSNHFLGKKGARGISSIRSSGHPAFFAIIIIHTACLYNSSIIRRD